MFGDCCPKERGCLKLAEKSNHNAAHTMLYVNSLVAYDTVHFFKMTCWPEGLCRLRGNLITQNPQLPVEEVVFYYFQRVKEFQKVQEPFLRAAQLSDCLERTAHFYGAQIVTRWHSKRLPAR